MKLSKGHGNALTEPSTSYSSRAFYVLAVLAPLAIVASPPYPPLVDIAQHGAQVALWASLLEGSSPFAHIFEVKLFTPYLLAYTALLGLSQFMSVVTAVKVLTTGCAIATTLAMERFVTRVLSKPSPLRALLLISPYGFAYQLGLLSFMVAIPIGFSYLTLLLSQRPKRYISIAFQIVFLHMLFFCHVLVLMAFGSIGVVIASRHGIKRAFQQILVLLSLAPIVTIWAIKTSQGPQETSIMRWQLYPARLLAYFQEFATPLFPARYILFSAILGVIILFLPRLLGFTIAKEPWRIAPLVGVSAVVLAAPNYVFDTAFVAVRFGVLLMPFLLIAFDAPIEASASAEANALAKASASAETKETVASNRQLRGARTAAAIVTVVLACHFFAALSFRNESADFDAMFKHCDPEAQTLILTQEPTSNVYRYPVYAHYPAWLQAKGCGIVDMNFAVFFPQPVTYVKEHYPHDSWDLERDRTQFDYDAYDAGRFDYYISRGHDLRSDLLAGRDVELVEQSGKWWLYRNSAKD